MLRTLSLFSALHVASARDVDTRVPLLPPSVKEEIEKLICIAVKDEVPEDKFASTTCVDLTKIIKFLPEKTCEDVVKTIWEDTLASCPKDINDAGLPVKEEIEKLVCTAVKDEVPEDKFVTTTCVDLKKMIKFLPEKTCEDAVKKIWEDTLASCPTDNVDILPPAVKEEIEKLVCIAVKDEVPEDKFVNTTCVDLTKVIKFLPEKTCEGVVKKIWEDTLASCPKDIVGASLPVKEEIEKLVCIAVKDEVPEDKFATTTCEELKKMIKFLPEKTCEDAVKTIWEDTMASCPKDINDAGLPVKEEIEKLVCTAVKDEVPEDKFVTTTCVDLKKIIKFLPEKTCEDAVKKIWEDTLASCPTDIVV